MSYLDKEKMAPVVVVILIVMLVYTSMNRQSGLVNKSSAVNPVKVKWIFGIRQTW